MTHNIKITAGELSNPQGKIILTSQGNFPELPENTFTADFLQTRAFATPNSFQVVVGLGNDPLNASMQKEVAAKGSALMKENSITSFQIELPDNLDPATIIEGLILGLYDYKLAAPDTTTYEIGIVGSGVTQALVEQAVCLAEGVVYARDLVNTPSNFLRPEDFATQVREMLQPLGVSCDVLHLDALRQKGLNGILAVGESSANPPCLLIMRYLPVENQSNPIGLVGKGVTFDSGGYSLKPPASMMHMKSDMGGAAAVVGALYGLAKNKIPVNVVGITPLCENRISNDAILPGEVYTAYSGKTIEVLNTDAEGRLILADAVAYAVQDEKVSKVIDIATLTGAAVNALGFGVAAAVDNSDELWDEFAQSFPASGERYWRMPTYPEYAKMIQSDIADLKNIGAPQGGCITGGLFIGSSAPNTPWLHLDIAGTAWSDTPLFAYQSKGGTGAGVAALYRYCVDQSK